MKLVFSLTISLRKVEFVAKFTKKVKKNPVVVVFDFTLANLMSIILYLLDIYLFFTTVFLLKNLLRVAFLFLVSFFFGDVTVCTFPLNGTLQTLLNAV